MIGSLTGLLLAFFLPSSNPAVALLLIVFGAALGHLTFVLRRSGIGKRRWLWGGAVAGAVVGMVLVRELLSTFGLLLGAVLGADVGVLLGVVMYKRRKWRKRS